MNYLTLSSVLRSHKVYIFTLEDVKNLFPRQNVKTIKNNFSRWLAKSYFSRLRKDLYEFREQGSDLGIPDLYVANRLYAPSYVSLETALSFYSIIPDVAAGVTSVTCRPTRVFKNKYGSFFYKSCQKKAFTGYRIITCEGFKVTMADKEKALVDFLYYRRRLNAVMNFKEERLNKKMLKKLDWPKAFSYVRLFNQATLKMLKACKEYTQC